jgi:hypothetical protein
VSVLETPAPVLELAAKSDLADGPQTEYVVVEVVQVQRDHLLVEKFRCGGVVGRRNLAPAKRPRTGGERIS